MIKIFNNPSILLLIGLANSCNAQELNYSMDTKYGVFKYSEIDTNTVKDLILACDKELPEICRELKIDFDHSVTIEVYPDQDSYNNSIIDPDLKNSPAISGDFRIQIISPLSPLEAEKKIGIIKYPDRMQFLIHEYVHILIDKLENPPPLCLDEGLASYFSSREFYSDMATKYVKQINFIPTIEQMITNYHKIPAPDLFSFILIDYFIQTQGREKLADIIRHSDNVNQFNDKWIDYVKNKYY